MTKKIFSALTLFALSAFSLNAQIKEGSILYDMKIEGLPPEQAAMMGDMETKVTFKDEKSLMEITSMMFTQQVSIDNNGMVFLIEQMGNKIGVKQTKAEIEKEEAKIKDKTPDPKIEYFDETKKIAGYDCKKAIATTIDKDKKETKVEIWYSDKFENPNKEGKGRGQNVMKGLKGVAFEYSTTMGPMKIKLVAKEVSIAPVPDSTFVLSTEGYKMVTMDEFKAMQGGK